MAKKVSPQAYQSVCDRHPEPLIVLNVAGEVVFANQAFLKFKSCTQSNLIGKTIDEIWGDKRADTALVAHQLQTPASAIRWLTEMLMQGYFGHISSEQISALEQIYASNNRMITLVKGLLDLTHLEREETNSHFEQIDLLSLVAAVNQELAYKKEEKKQNLIIVRKRRALSITTNPKLVHQVLLNLVDNALKYSPEYSTITITLALRQHAVFVQVEDQGCGIPEDQLPFVFDRFYRAVHKASPTVTGNGLGLHIVEKIIHHLKGEIGITSTVAVGTKVWFSLPTQLSFTK